MLRFSDDDAPNAKSNAAKSERQSATPTSTSTSAKAEADEVKAQGDPAVKPNFVYINTGDEDSMVVQHILAVRKGRREVKSAVAPSPDAKPNAKPDDKATSEESVKSQGESQEKGPACDSKVSTEEEEAIAEVPDAKVVKTESAEGTWVDVEEFFVKYRNFSYLHCEWKTEEELYKGDKRIPSKIKRFKQKMAHQVNIFENVSVHLGNTPRIL